MILKSTGYTYTTYNSQAILLQATPTPSQPPMILQATCYTHTTYKYATPTNKQIFKYMLYLHFALILVTILNLCSALKFRTYICVYTKSLPNFVLIFVSIPSRYQRNGCQSILS